MTTAQDASPPPDASWNAGDLDGYLELYDEPSACTATRPSRWARTRSAASTGHLRAFDSPQLEFHEVLWDGDECTIRFTMSGRHVGDFMGTPRPASTRVPGITILHFDGDRTIERFRRPTCSAGWRRWARSRRPPELGPPQSLGGVFVVK